MKNNYPIGTIVMVCSDSKRAYVGLVINPQEWIKLAHKYNCAFPDSFDKNKHLGIRILGTKLEKAWGTIKKKTSAFNSDHKIILRYISENPSSVAKYIFTNEKKYLKSFLECLNILERIGQLPKYMQDVSKDLIALYIHLFGTDNFVTNDAQMNYDENHKRYLDSVLSKE